MAKVTGRPGELNERLLDLVDRPDPQLRAVATTLLIKAVDVPDQDLSLIEALVASDDAAAMIDATAAASASVYLRHGLSTRLEELAADHGEHAVVRTMRDHLDAQMERWASRALDDAENRKKAERFLAWADRPGQLEAAQRRGLFAGMGAEELRQLADTRVGGPVTAETAVTIWAKVASWTEARNELLGDSVLSAWKSAPGA